MILDQLRELPVQGIAAASLLASRRRHEAGHATAGNGTLMRTAAVALAYLDDPDALVPAAPELATVTHFDPDGGEACALWCLAIRHAVLTGELDVRVGLDHLTARRREEWEHRIELAERSRPAEIEHNGWVVGAFQAAWSAIATTPVPADDHAAGTFRADHLRLSLENAVRGGRDTDTVAAIAGGLLGGVYGASAAPAQWRGLLHGWPGFGARDLLDLAGRIVRKGGPDGFDFAYRGYPVSRSVVPHPHDDGVLLGGIGALRSLPAGVDAVVSLCRVGDDDIPDVPSWVEVRLIDRNGVEHNPNLDFVLADTVAAIERLRDEGRIVLLHCVQTHSRTPSVAALYGMRRRGIGAERALDDICRVLPQAYPNSDFRAALTRAERAGR
jgi:hypothetical protein